MLGRFVLTSIAILVSAGPLYGQKTTADSPKTNTPAWRPAGQSATESATLDTAGENPADGAAAVNTNTSLRRVTQVSQGKGTLPNEHGQVWREYDISPYTVRVTSTKRPEQAIVDWVLRETGYEVWHSEPLGILSATPRALRVYHTPEMQAVVADLVDRFVCNEAQTCTFSLRVVTVDHPNWRVRAQRMLRPVEVQSPSASAWLLQKEEAAMLLADLRRRRDYREHSSPHMMVNNGQSTVVCTLRDRTYVRDVVLRPDVWPGYEARTAHLDEGFSLEFNPLLSADRAMIDATIKCNIDQVEKMIPVMLDVPTREAPRQRTRIEIPQMAHCRFHERFRWPVGQVLLVSMGMVALPVPVEAKPKELIPGIPLPMTKSPPRADLLVFVESKGNTIQDPRVARTPRDEAKTYRGRY